MSEQSSPSLVAFGLQGFMQRVRCSRDFVMVLPSRYRAATVHECIIPQFESSKLATTEKGYVASLALPLSLGLAY